MTIVRSTFFALISAACLTLGFSGCNKKGGCTDPNAENFDPSAEMEDGTCIAQRDKFIGFYDVSYQCNRWIPEQTIPRIVKSTITLDQIWIQNFDEFQNSIVATVSRNTIIIPRQHPDADGHYIEGEGIIVGNTLTITYTVKHGGLPTSPPSNSCTARLIK